MVSPGQSVELSGWAIDRKYALLNSIGAGLWILGFFMAAGMVYPYAFVGLYAAPPFLLLGGLGWIRHYRRTRGAFPNPIRSYRRLLARQSGWLDQQLASFQFMFKNLFVFWGISVFAWMLLTFVGTTIFKATDAYALAKLHVQRDESLRKSIGEICYYGFLAGGTVRSNGDNEVTLTVVGERGIREAHIEMEQGDTGPHVVAATYR